MDKAPSTQVPPRSRGNGRSLKPTAADARRLQYAPAKSSRLAKLIATDRISSTTPIAVTYRMLTAAAALLVSLSLVEPLPAQVRDTVTYSNAATRTLINDARVRHMVQDSLVDNYTARVATRIEGRMGSNVFDRGLPIFAHEIVSRVRWSAPNNLSVDVSGARLAAARIPGWNDYAWAGFWTQEFAHEPWFVPRTFSDSVQMVGIPDRAALHPLAVEGELYYYYAIADSVTITLPGRTIRALGVDVRPKELGPSFVAGRMWLDAETLDVVRLSIVFVGTELTDDEDEDLTTVHIHADLEYSLHHSQAWMPHRQVLLVRWEVPFFRSASLWFTMTTDFSEYEINTDVAPSQPRAKASDDRADQSSWQRAWRCEDVMMFGQPGKIRASCGQGSLEHSAMVNGINYRVRVPALDSLLAFPFENELSLFSSSAERERTDRVIADLAHVAAGLPGSLNPTRAHHPFGRSIGQLVSIPRFNRVQGFSVGAAVELPVPLAFTSLSASARLGIADERPVGSVAWIRNAPESRFELTAFRTLKAVEPWTNARSFGTSLKTAILGWDDADYYLSLGGGMKFRGRMGPLRNITLELNFERQRSVITAAGSAVNDFFLGDGIYPVNPAIVAGDFGRASLGYSNSWSRFALT